MKGLYAFAPEPGEPDAGTVKLADDDGVHHTWTAHEARAFGQQLLSLADFAEGKSGHHDD